jgi:hypothetical protein
MNKITGPQAAVLTVIGRQTGGASKAQLIEAGCDIRSANNLVKQGRLTLSPLNVYTIEGIMPEFDEAREVVVQSLDPAAPEADVEDFLDAVAEELPKPANEPTIAQQAAAIIGECLCGCKEPANSRFRIGHDARLHGQVVRAKKKNTKVVVSESAAAWLMTKPWAIDGYTTESVDG